MQLVQKNTTSQTRTPFHFSLSDHRTDRERIYSLTSVAVTASQILELSSRPWVYCSFMRVLMKYAKRNPRLLTTISASPEKIKKRRKPSKKERDYKKKMKLEEEKKARNERRYEKFLKYGHAQGGSRGKFNRGFSRRRVSGMGGRGDGAT